MMTTRPDRAGRPGRAAPKRWAVRVGLVAVSLAALLSQGCSSFGGGGGASACGGGGCGGGCGSKCGLGGLGARLTSFNLGQKLFHHKSAVATDSCDSSLGAMQVDPGGAGSFPSGSVLQAPPSTGDPDLQPLNNGGSLSAALGRGQRGAGLEHPAHQVVVPVPDRRDARRGPAGPPRSLPDSRPARGHPQADRPERGRPGRRSLAARRPDGRREADLLGRTPPRPGSPPRPRRASAWASAASR